MAFFNVPCNVRIVGHTSERGKRPDESHSDQEDEAEAHKGQQARRPVNPSSGQDGRSENGRDGQPSADDRLQDAKRAPPRAHALEQSPDLIV